MRREPRGGLLSVLTRLSSRRARGQWQGPSCQIGRGSVVAYVRIRPVRAGCSGRLNVRPPDAEAFWAGDSARGRGRSAVLKGDLATTPLPSVLEQLADGLATGCLHVTDPHGDVAKI